MASIIIAEDETILATLMRSQLEGAGHKVRTATNGQEAWELLEAETPDVVLSDLLMPEMSGYELLEKMRADERFKKIPCLVLSNSGQIDDLNRAFTVGATDVLIKANFNPEQLIGKVEGLLTQIQEKSEGSGSAA